MADDYAEEPELEEVEAPDVVDEEEEDFYYDEESPNLVVEFKTSEAGRKALRKICEKVKEDFDSAWDGAEMYRDKMLKNWKLFAGELPPRQPPYQDMANAHIPTLLQNITLVSSRMEDELFGDWSNWFSVLPTGTEDEAVADILSKHGEWQFSEQIIDFQRQMSRGILYFLFGDVFFQSSWDPARGVNRHDALSPDEVVVPYTHVTTMPDMSDLPWRARVYNYERHEMQARKGDWEGIDEILDEEKPTEDAEPLAKLSKESSEILGVDSSEGAATPYKVILYEGWLSDEYLPNQATDRFCQVFMEYGSEKILKLTIHEEVNWQEQIRIERQRGELEHYKQELERYAAMQEQLRMMREQAQMDQGIGPMNEMAAMQAEQQGLQIPLPPAPDWMLDPNDLTEEPPPPEMSPIHMFVHGVCIEPMTGNLGLGLATSQADLNRAMNVVMSQFIDSATMANSRTLLTTNGVTFEGGQLQIGPGKVNKIVGAIGDKISESIMPLEFGPANSQMLQMIELFSQMAEGVGQAPGILAGAPGKSGETFRGVNLRAEQATKQLSTLARRYASGPLTQLLKNNARLNSIFMEEDELIYVTDHLLHRLRPMQVSRRMYERGYSVRFRADMRFSSQQQRISEADEIAQMPMAFPALQQNWAFQQRALAKSLEARDKQDMLPMLGPEMPAPQTPLGLPPQMVGMAPQGPPPGQTGAPQNGPPPAGAPPAPVGPPPGNG